MVLTNWDTNQNTSSVSNFVFANRMVQMSSKVTVMWERNILVYTCVFIVENVSLADVENIPWLLFLVLILHSIYKQPNYWLKTH